MRELEVQLLPEAGWFLGTLSEKARDKIFENINKTKAGYRGEWFKKMEGTDGIWEFRTMFNKTYYRLFAFWHKVGNSDSLIICTHGLIKTTDKTPTKELTRAEKLKKEFQSY